MRACLLQPDVVHRPLLVWRSWVVGCASGTASGVEPAAVGGTTATDGELAFLLDGWGLLLLPVVANEASRMEDGHEQDSWHHHASLEDHERDLSVGELTLEAVCEFCDTEAGTNQDEHECGGKH